MNSFVTIRSVLLIITLYIAFIINNSFSQIFQSNPLLYSLFLSFILAELFSYTYRLIYSHSVSLEVFLANILLSFFLLLFLPFLLNYFIVFVALLFYSMVISVISIFFPLEDQSNSFWTCENDINSTITISEQKGVFFSYYTVDLFLPLGFLSTEDKRNYFDLIRNNDSHLTYSLSHSCHFTFSGKGFKFFPSTRNQLLQMARDIKQLSENIAIE